jgi:hypothetical protein
MHRSEIMMKTLADIKLSDDSRSTTAESVITPATKESSQSQPETPQAVKSNRPATENGEFVALRDRAAILKREGQTVSLKGKINRVSEFPQSNHFFLNFTDTSSGGALVPSKDDNPAGFGLEALKKFVNKPVVVRGKIPTFQGAPQKVVKAPVEITVL